MVVGTTRDPATPYALGQCAGLASSTPGVLVSRDGDGHTGFNQGNQCVDDAVENYLLGGKVPEGRPVLLTGRFGDGPLTPAPYTRPACPADRPGTAPP